MPEPDELSVEITKLTLEEQKAEANNVIRQVEDFTYINAAFTTATNWDVRIVFAERLPSDKTVPRVSIVMSHQHAKAFLTTLATNIARLEQLGGPIKILGERKMPTP